MARHGTICTTVRAPSVQHAEDHKAMEREAQARQRAASTIGA